MKGYLLSRPAEDDIREILDYIRGRSAGAAKRVRSRFHTAMREIALMPGLGHLREDLADQPVRFYRVYSYLIVYRPDTRPIQILRVLHAARDIKEVLGQDAS